MLKNLSTNQKRLVSGLIGFVLGFALQVILMQAYFALIIVGFIVIMGNNRGLQNPQASGQELGDPRYSYFVYGLLAYLLSGLIGMIV